LAKPDEHITIIEPVALAVNYAPGILMIALASRDDFIDDQIFWTTKADGNTWLHFFVSAALDGYFIVRRVCKAIIDSNRASTIAME